MTARMSGTLQKERERLMFLRFSRVCPIDIDEKSVGEQQPPFPDIGCKNKEGKRLDFELTEIISESAAQGLANLSFGDEIEQHLETYGRRQEFGERFGNKQIWLQFYEYFENEAALNVDRRRVTRRVILGAAHRLFDLLLFEKNRGKKKIHPFEPYDRYLARILAEVVIQDRPDFNPTLFETTGVIPYEPVDELLLRAIIRKCSRRYEAANELHLLAYFDFQPTDFHSDWEKRITRLCQRRGSRSQFSRLWLFTTAGQDRVFYMYPNGVVR